MESKVIYFKEVHLKEQVAGQAKAGRKVVKIHYGKGLTYGKGVGTVKPTDTAPPGLCSRHGINHRRTEIRQEVWEGSGVAAVLGQKLR